jgi:hypothetical protein
VIHVTTLQFDTGRDPTHNSAPRTLPCHRRNGLPNGPWPPPSTINKAPGIDIPSPIDAWLRYANDAAEK